MGARDRQAVSTTARSAGIALLFAVLTITMTWPQAAHWSTRVYDADDPLLSIWRLSWVAHVLPRSPTDLFNGNIFHPEQRTLAYTDSVLLYGFAGAPLIWSGVSKVTTYNLLLLLSMALSGWAMWRYAWYLTRHFGGAILAGITFAFVPFRFDHFHHLELQATIFLPLTLLYFERLIDRQSTRDAWLMSACYVAQVYSCIYYSVFLATVLIPIAAIRLWNLPADQRASVIRKIIPAAIVTMVAIAPYAYTYALNRQTLGERLDSDVHFYSATLSNYLATTAPNVLHGGWSASFGQPERFLFPGVMAMALAIAGALAIDRRRISLITIGAIAFVISLGLNSPFYEPLRAILLPYRGLRAPARASILVFLAIAALGAYGWARVMRGRSRSVTTIATAIVALLLLIEFRTTLDRWLTIPAQPAQVYRWLSLQPRSVVAEVPFARSSELDRLYDGLYMFNSTWHWQPLVNGYSGFFPPTFIELSDRTRSFPDEASLSYLKQRGVDLLVIHGGFMTPEQFGEMTATLLARPDIEAMAQFDEPRGWDVVFRLRR